MSTGTVRCPVCGSVTVSKNGHNKTGKQVYNCNNPACQRRCFVEEYTYRAYDPEVRQRVVEMHVGRVEGHTVATCKKIYPSARGIGRELGISKDTVTSIVKKHQK